MHRALVTGASGFIGRAVCLELLARDWQVTALCARLPADLPPGVTALQCNLHDRPTLLRVIGCVQPDCIHHLAGYTSATRELDAVPASFDANVVTSVNLLHAVSTTGCGRLVLPGSMEEGAPGEIPSSPYAASKMTVSQYAAMFHRLYRTPVSIGRVFMAYGPGQRDVHKLVPHTILSLLRGDDPEYGSGRRRIDWIYIDDLARGLVDLGETAALAGETVDLGSGTLTSVRDLVGELVRLTGSSATPRFDRRPDRTDEQERRADVERTARLLRWRARTSLTEGLALTVRHYAALHAAPHA